MANHKSAKKRSRQSNKRDEVNSQVLTKLKTNINKFQDLLKDKNKEELDKSLSYINSSLSKAVKKGIIKKTIFIKEVILVIKKN